MLALRIVSADGDLSQFSRAHLDLRIHDASWGDDAPSIPHAHWVLDGRSFRQNVCAVAVLAAIIAVGSRCPVTALLPPRPADSIHHKPGCLALQAHNRTFVWRWKNTEPLTASAPLSERVQP